MSFMLRTLEPFVRLPGALVSELDASVNDNIHFIRVIYLLRFWITFIYENFQISQVVGTEFSSLTVIYLAYKFHNFNMYFSSWKERFQDAEKVPYFSKFLWKVLAYDLILEHFQSLFSKNYLEIVSLKTWK